MAFFCVSPSIAGVTDNIYLGDDALKTGNYDSAIAYYLAASDEYPEYTLPYILIANVYYLEGDYDNSLANAEHALLIDSEDKGALLAKARALNGLGGYKSSLIYFENLLKDDATNTQLIFGKTRVLLKIYGSQEALKYLIETSENLVNIQTAEYYDLLGDLYLDLDDPKLAKINYQKALEIDSGFSNTHEKYDDLISQEQITTQQYSELYVAALEWYESGITQVKKRQYNDALESFNTAYNIDPSLFDSILPYTAYIYIKLKDYSNATKVSQYLVLQDDSNAKAWNYLGIAYEKTGEFDEAKDAYEKAISLEPSDKNAKLNLLWMELKKILFNPIFVFFAILLFSLIFTSAWILVLKRKSKFHVFGVLGIILGIIIGAIIILCYSDYHPMMGFLNTIIGCSVIGLFCGSNYLKKSVNCSKIKDISMIKWNPNLTSPMIIGGIFAGFINTYYAKTAFFNTINGIILGILIVFFSFDILVSKKCGLDLINLKNKYKPLANNHVFYIFIISVYFWSYLISYYKSNSNSFPDVSTPIFGLFGFLCFIGLVFPIFMAYDRKTSISRLKEIVTVYILCIIPGIALYIIFNLFNTYGTMLSEKPIFILIISTVIFYLIFSKFDNRISHNK